MARAHAVALAVLVFPVALPPPAAAADNWVAAHSPHFVVISNAGESPARRVAHQFEQIRALFESGFKVRLDPGRPFFILAVRNEQDMKELAPWYWERRGGIQPVGLFSRGVEKHYALLRLDAGDQNQPYHVLYHEYVHLVTGLNYRRLPLWLSEGLAEFYAGADIDEQEVRWGRLQPWHVLVLREQALLPVPELLSADQGSPYYTEGNRATIFYAQAAVLTHYLMVGAPERRGQLSALIQQLGQDVPEDEALQHTLGDVKKLETELRAYVHRSAFAGFKRPERLDVQTVRVYPLSKGEAAAIRGDFLLHQGRPRDAQPLLEKALAEAPNLSSVHESLGLLALRAGRKDEAARELARALELSAQNYLALYYADVLTDQTTQTPEQVQLRERNLRRVLQLNPQFSPAHARLTRLLLDGERWSEALAVGRRACELDPAIIWYGLLVKQALTHLGRVDEAAKIEQSILQAGRSDPEALASVVSHYREDGRREEAEALLRRARETNPRSVRILQQLARFLDQGKRPADAEAVLREALKLQPESPYLQNNLAYLLAEGGAKAAEALELVDKALKREPKSAYYLDTRGWALFKLKRLPEAEEALRKSLDARPGEAVVQGHLGDVLMARGNRAAALAQWRQALTSPDLSDEQKQALEAKLREAER